MKTDSGLHDKLNQLMKLKDAGVADYYQFSISVKNFGRELYQSDITFKEKIDIVDKFNECYKDTKLSKLFISCSLDLWRAENNLAKQQNNIDVSSKKVSVQVPVYNKAAFGLSRALDSIINQTHQNLEIICVNDASTDNSLQVLQEYAKKDNRIKIINFEQNQKVLAGRVASFEAATGDYIVCIDPDDWVDNDYVKEMLELAVSLDVDVLRCNGTSKEYVSYGAVYEVPFSTEHWNASEMSISLWGKIYKSSVIKSAISDMKKLKSFNLGDDGVLLLYILKRAKTIGSARTVSQYHYELNSQSITNGKNLLNQAEDVLYICQVLSSEFESLHVHKQIFNLFKTFVLPYFNANKFNFDHIKSMTSQIDKNLLSILLTFSSDNIYTQKHIYSFINDNKIQDSVLLGDFLEASKKFTFGENISFDKFLSYFGSMLSDFSYYMYERLSTKERETFISWILKEYANINILDKVTNKDMALEFEKQCEFALTVPKTDTQDKDGDLVRVLDLSKLGYDMKLYTHPNIATAIDDKSANENFYKHWIVSEFIRKQYHHEQVNVAKGDVILDCGAFVGDSALVFAHDTNFDCEVHLFEIMNKNISFIKRNIEANPKLQNLLKVNQLALADKSDIEVHLSENGASSKVGGSGLVGSNHYKSDYTVKTISIDDYVRRNGLKKVDFIKMDIEGHETPALEGARETISKFKPKLAICVYHKPDDCKTIPKILLEYNKDYKFYFGWNNIAYGWEAVLYAKP